MKDFPLCVSHCALPEAGEDSYSFQALPEGFFACVTDGCGGLGSRRYPSCGNFTGAYVASRLAARFMAQEAAVLPFPSGKEEGEIFVRECSSAISRTFEEYLSRLESGNPSPKIVGTMQRPLPTTLAGAFLRQREEGLEVLFAWAGDSRGYVLDEDGLHQFTADHVRGNGANEFVTLYQDRPLSRLFYAGGDNRPELRHTVLRKPGLVILATDGAYSGLSTPMEFEMLLLDCLVKALHGKSWKTKLTNRLGKMASDDATLILLPWGFSSFEEMQETLLSRRARLQKAYITPVRTRKKYDFAQTRWEEYRQGYDRTEAAGDGNEDWRL